MVITILGAGAWGTIIAISLSSKINVVLLTRNVATFESIKEKRESYKLPDCLISDNVLVKLAIEDTVNASVIILAVPT